MYYDSSLTGRGCRIDRHHTELVSKSVAALKAAQSERKLCKPGKVSSTDYLAEVQKLLCVLSPIVLGP